ncbi:GIY-YIG nuclease family protein [Brumimicrobium sp.]
MQESFLYILRCCDGSYYTGMTNNLNRRRYEHNSGLNPKS